MPHRCIIALLVLFANTSRNVLCVGPPINLNIRRSAQSQSIRNPTDGHATAKSTGEEESVSASKKKGGTGRWGGVALDLAGAFNCHVSSPSLVSPGRQVNDNRKPLFRLGRTNGAPSFFLGGRYDFSRVWYGATVLFASLSWDGQRAKGRMYGGTYGMKWMEDGDEPPTQASRMKRMRNNLSRCTLTIRAEKDLRGAEDFAAHVSLVKNLKSDDNPYLSVPPSLTFRVDLGTSSRQAAATVSIRTPVHDRVDVVSKSIALLDSDRDGPTNEEDGQHFASQVPPLTTAADWSEGSWLPDVRLSPTGWLTARSNVGFLPFSRDRQSNNGMRAGVRLRISKQIPWTLWGTPDDEEEHETWVKFQLCGVDASGDTYGSIALDAALERIVETARLTLTQEQILRMR